MTAAAKKGFFLEIAELDNDLYGTSLDAGIYMCVCVCVCACMCVCVCVCVYICKEVPYKS